MKPFLAILSACILSATALVASDVVTKTPQQLDALYHGLDPSSISQHLAFYKLYPDTPQGRDAYDDAIHLLGGNSYDGSTTITTPLPSNAINTMVSLITVPGGTTTTTPFTDDECLAISNIASRLKNRHLPGYNAATEEEVLSLDDTDIDIARALLLSYYGDDDVEEISRYEALLDIMSLEILAGLSDEAPPEDIIRAISRFVFETMRFRFPPESLYRQDIDYYTFLPSVLDSRRGVCLGVSTLYLCIAQRLGLDLEVVTPPGHIFLRYRHDDGTFTNIETTARGIDIPTESYLGINTRSLQERSYKEVIGLAHYNQASVWWQGGDYDKALASYQKAVPYLPNDTIAQEFLAYAFIATGDKNKGKKILKAVHDVTPDDLVCRDTIADEYLDGNVDIDGIAMLFTHTDETRVSIFEKQEKLHDILELYPKFRAGHLALSITWLQLSREKEALQSLQKYHALDSGDPTVEYYLSTIYFSRQDYKNAYIHLSNVLALTASRDHKPKALEIMKRTLEVRSSE